MPLHGQQPIARLEHTRGGHAVDQGAHGDGDGDVELLQRGRGRRRLRVRHLLPGLLVRLLGRLPGREDGLHGDGGLVRVEPGAQHGRQRDGTGTAQHRHRRQVQTAGRRVRLTPADLDERLAARSRQRVERGSLAEHHVRHGQHGDDGDEQDADEQREQQQDRARLQPRALLLDRARGGRVRLRRCGRTGEVVGHARPPLRRSWAPVWPPLGSAYGPRCGVRERRLRRVRARGVLAYRGDVRTASRVARDDGRSPSLFHRPRPPAPGGPDTTGVMEMSDSQGGLPERRDDEEPDPLAAMLQAMFGPGGVDPEQLRSMLPPGLADMPGFPRDAAGLQAMLAQVQQMFAGGGDGPVNWEAAHDVARAVAAGGGDPTVPDSEQRQVAEALRTADLWLDSVTDLPSATARSEAWSRADWGEKTLPPWKGIVEPIAASVAEAMSTAMAAQAPEEMRSMLGGALPMVRRMGGAFFGAQLGQALGTLAGEVVGAGDTGLPLLPAGRAALLPANIAAFGEGLGLDADEVRLYLALREAAHARLIAGVPWLRSHLLGAVEEYARGITIDTAALEEAVRNVDPSDPSALQEALQSGLFEPQTTPQQRAALDRLETALALGGGWIDEGVRGGGALVEGWIDEVVDEAAATALPHRDALRETVRRRRAAGGPAEHIFASLVGLELRPRRLRGAGAVWAALARERGAAGRDALWAPPDLAPTADAFV